MEFQHLMNKTIHCSLLIYSPDVNPCILDEGFACKNPGYEMELLDIVRKKLHLNFTYSIPKDLQFGGLINGNWNGIVAQVLQGETNFSCKQLTYTATRSEAVDFGYPIKYVKQGFIIKNPGVKAAEFNFSKFIQWQFYLLMLFTLLTFFVIVILDRKIRKLKNKPISHPVAMFLQFITGGVNDDPDESWGLRIFTFITLLMFGIIYTYFFTYILQASFIVKNSLPFQNTQELSQLIIDDNYRVIADSLSTAWYVEVYNSKMEMFRSFKNVLLKIPPIIEPNQTKILDRISNDQMTLVYSHNIDILRKLVNSQCDKYLIIEDGTPYVSFSSYVFPKGSPYNKAFAWALMELHEFAEKTLKMKYYPFAPCNMVTNSLDDYGIVQTIIYKSTIYFVGFLTVSLVAFIGEIVVHYKHICRSNNNCVTYCKTIVQKIKR